MDSLIAAAMAGSQRRSAALTDPLFEGLTGPPEAQLLGAAALAGIAGLAGQRPHSGPPLTPDSVDDTRSLAPGRSLRRILEGDFRQLLPEWLQLAEKAQLRPDPSQLPHLLEIGRNDRSLRPLLAVVGGPRAVWLASHNPDWAYLLGQGPGEESIWETGQSAVRLEWFANFRQRDPEAARKLLITGWSQQSADERQKCLQALTAGLSMNDEDFLESALDDRSKGVRAQAAALLARLPQSRLAQRARARVSGWVMEHPGHLQIELPGECNRPMQRDGIEPKSPRSDLGDKAWWLLQALSQCPLDLWRNTPAQLLRAAAMGDWTQPLCQGWLQATLAQADLTWANALLDAGLEHEQLFALLPHPHQEERLLAKLHEGWLKIHRPYSPRLAAALLPWLRQRPSQDYDWNWSNLLGEVALRLPPDTPVEEGWSEECRGRPVLEKMISTVKFRQSMHEELR